MLVYDITNEKSFDNIKNWLRNIEEVCCVWYYSFLFADLLQKCVLYEGPLVVACSALA